MSQDIDTFRSGFNSKINLIKSDIARAMNAEWKHPAPTVASVGAATVRSVGSAWTQSVTTYLGAGVTFAVPSVVVLAGWPEYGSVLPVDPTNGDDYGTCAVYEANAYVNGSNTVVWQHGACPAGQTEVHRFAHCSSAGVIESVPEIGSSITFGTRTDTARAALSGLDSDNVFFGDGSTDVGRCRQRSGSQSWTAFCDTRAREINSDPTAMNTNYLGLVTINNVTVKEYTCGSGHYHWDDGVGSYGPHGWRLEDWRQLKDVLCCTGG